jgi:hypothetical protein
MEWRPPQLLEPMDWGFRIADWRLFQGTSVGWPMSLGHGGDDDTRSGLRPRSSPPPPPKEVGHPPRIGDFGLRIGDCSDVHRIALRPAFQRAVRGGTRPSERGGAHGLAISDCGLEIVPTYIGLSSDQLVNGLLGWDPSSEPGYVYQHREVRRGRVCPGCVTESAVPF